MLPAPGAGSASCSGQVLMAAACPLDGQACGWQGGKWGLPRWLGGCLGEAGGGEEPNQCPPRAEGQALPRARAA